MNILLFSILLCVSPNLVLSLPSKGKLIFEDEFNGNSIDEKKWNIYVGNGCENGWWMCGMGNWVSVSLFCWKA